MASEGESVRQAKRSGPSWAQQRRTHDQTDLAQDKRPPVSRFNPNSKIVPAKSKPAMPREYRRRANQMSLSFDGLKPPVGVNRASPHA